MKLTLRTDYALRTLIYLGLHPDRLASIKEIATAYEISENHLVKVVHHLGQKGLIETIRGKGGGIRLRGEAKDIRIGDVVRMTEDDMALVQCFQSPDSASSGCLLTNACLLQGLLQEALDAFMAKLDAHTLADLLASPHDRAIVQRLLWVDAATH